MGAPSQSLLDSHALKDIVLGSKGTITSSTIPSNNGPLPLWNKVLETQRAKLIGQQTKRRDHQKRLRKHGGVLMKKRAIVRREGLRRSDNGLEKRVQTLKRLIPNRESQGLDGLFRDTAAYIFSLQMRVRVMQVMVDVLDNGSQGDHRHH